MSKGSSKYVLGIDTSNYKTSIAIIDDSGRVICDFRRPLEVKPGQRGLRQSEAFFQHIKALPTLIEAAREGFKESLSALACSSRPRPVQGSYMPVFVAGESIGRSIAAAMQIPKFNFSHQEGHIEAVKAFSTMREKDTFLACHFSGGTCELLKCRPSSIEIIGGTRDISYGQVIDRTGVALGYDFPAGEALDKIAQIAPTPTELLTKIKVEDSYLNLSGIDTQIKNILDSNAPDNREGLVHELFQRLCESMITMISQAVDKHEIRDVILTGGVSSSEFMKERITEALRKRNINPDFGYRGLAQDNAVGIALLGGKKLWG